MVDRPAPFALTLISAKGPDAGAFDWIPLTIAPDPPLANPSKVSVTVAPQHGDLYAVQVRWTYIPALCTRGQDPLDAGCAPRSPPYWVVGSLMRVSLPHGATILHCQRCTIVGDQVELPERDSPPVVATPGLPDASVYANSTNPPAPPVTATWTFEVHDTTFAWAANGLTAEASLPVVNFQNNGNTGYGAVDVTYRIPGGAGYDWNNGPGPDHLTWSEPVGSATTAIQVAGNNNNAARRDTLDVLIVGILLGTAGGALVGSIQELAHAELEGVGGRLRRRKGRRH